MRQARNRAEGVTVPSTKAGVLIRRLRRRDRKADKIARVLAELEVALRERRAPPRAALTVRLAKR
jgi:hypothetical protein